MGTEDGPPIFQLSYHFSFPLLLCSSVVVFSSWEKVSVGKQREKTTNTAVELFNEPE